MIGTIRRHQHWLWVFIILAIIISFVVYFSPNSGSMLEGGRDFNFGSINNRPITQKQYREAHNEIELFYFLRAGRWPGRDESRQTGFDIERETYNRLAVIEKLNEMKIKPSTEATAKWIGEVFTGNSDQPFPMDRFQGFVKQELEPRGLTSEDFYRFAEHQVGQQHLMSVIGLSGKLITPAEGESFYRRLNEPLVTEAVFFSASNYVSKVSATPANLGQFYTNNMSYYRLPERVQVNYVKWDLTNFLAEADKQIAQVTNLSQRLEAAYYQRGTNSFVGKDGKPLSKEAALTQIKEDERKGLALLEARKKANEFLTELIAGHDEKNPFKPDDLEKLAKAKGLQVKTTPPFSQRDGADLLNVPPNFVTVAFRLSNNDPEDLARELLYNTSPIVAEDGVYAVGFNKRIPSEIEPFDKVQTRLKEDYRAEESMRLARAAGAEFEKALTNGIAQGKTFSEIAAQAKVKPVTLPKFSLSTQALPELGDQVGLDVLQNIATTLATGRASDFIATRNGGLVLHLKEKLPVDEAKLKTELPEFLTRQREQRAAAAFSDWLQKLPDEVKLQIPAKTSDGNS